MPTPSKNIAVALLTGGGDRPYALGLASTLDSQRVLIDFIGSDDLDLPELRRVPSLNFLNLRGDQRSDAPIIQKLLRITTYYVRLLRYSITARPKIFHILWNNRFELFDRTILMIYYRLLGKRLVLTAHNVNAAKRDGNDTFLNRASLSLQYRLADHIFVHTSKMKSELVNDFDVRPHKISEIPLGLNDTVPISDLTAMEARKRLGIDIHERVLLFFGRISPYKGLEYLVRALADVCNTYAHYRLLIVGSVQNCAEYWENVQMEIRQLGIQARVITRIEFVPDHETELYFKGSDVLVLPYADVFQSGVLVLAYSFGLPVIAADVGCLSEDVVDGQTGYIFRSKNSADLARKIEIYFASSLFRDLESRRHDIRDYANKKYSWAQVGQITRNVYETLSDECSQRASDG